jgi:sugar phosphate isomerase/epimerase
MFVFPTVTRQMRREVRTRLEDYNLALTGAEFFLMTEDQQLAAYSEGLACGRELGARHVMTHVFDTDRQRALSTLGTFCERAATEDLQVCIEFCQLTPGCRSIEAAAWFVAQVGRANLGLNICPLHLIRSGGTAAKVAALEQGVIFNGQINDGHGLHSSSSYFDEVHDRELPGAGEFPLAEILGALPADTPVEVKIPSARRQRQSVVSASSYVAEAAARSRSLLDEATLCRL